MAAGRDEDELFGGGGEHDEAPVVDTRRMLQSNPPPAALPVGWFLKPSRSYPGSYYYFNDDSGECSWEFPTGPAAGGGAAGAAGAAADPAVTQETLAAAEAAVKSIFKNNDRDAPEAGEGAGKNPSPAPPRKKAKTSETRAPNRDEPKEVRTLHILKKHRGSRRPASWRNPKITDSKEKAMSDLRELMSILDESKGNVEELRATFEELAKTESDCSSAKRGGDLGFFGRKKMQPAFEKASFGLKVGELSDIVDTSSGVHVILRIA